MDPRSIRTNNPGALNYGPFAQRWGAVGSDGRLAIFPDVETGRRAMSGLLDTYERQHGLNTVSGIIGRWAPRGVDNNSTDLYIKTVASKLGVDPNAPLTAQHRPGLMDAMAAYEAGTSHIPRSSGSVPVSAAFPAFPASSPEQPPMDNGWSLSKALASPMFQGGLGGFLAAARGGDTNEGMAAGGQRAAMMQRQQMLDDEAMRKRRIEAAFNQPGALAGVSPEIASIARILGAEQGGNLIAKSLMDQMQSRQNLETQKQLIDYRNQTASTEDIREFQYAKQNGFAGGFQEWMKQKRDMNGQTAQQITWGTDDKGNYVPMQASRDGKLVASQMPPGVTPVPSEVLAFRKAQATEQGQATGKAKVDLASVETNARLMEDALTAIEKDEYLPQMTEGVSAWLPNVTQQARSSQARIDQVQGKAFLQAYAGLRGGGAITEAEGQKATASISRLQSMQVGTEEYRKALADVRKEVQALVELARRKAAMGEPSATVRPSPQAAPADAGGWSLKRLD